MDDRDTADLRQFGYAQQLRRSLGSFSSFAVAFSLSPSLPASSANFGHGLRQVGGALVWSWLIVLAGQMLVASLAGGTLHTLPAFWLRLPVDEPAGESAFRLLCGLAVDASVPHRVPGVCATLATQTGSWLGGLGRAVRRDRPHARRHRPDRPGASLRHPLGLPRQQHRRLDGTDGRDVSSAWR